jgi:hypothetical protein
VIYRSELKAGDGQLIVLYQPEDSGGEIGPHELYSFIAEDAARLSAERGLRLLSMTSTALRHSAAGFGREGSGYQTKVCVAVAYAKLFNSD